MEQQPLIQRKGLDPTNPLVYGTEWFCRTVWAPSLSGAFWVILSTWDGCIDTNIFGGFVSVVSIGLTIHSMNCFKNSHPKKRYYEYASIGINGTCALVDINLLISRLIVCTSHAGR